MNPVINQNCVAIPCIGRADADMLTLWRMFQAAALLLFTKSKLQLFAMAEKLSCNCCFPRSHVAEHVQHMMSLLDTDFHLHR